LPGYQDGARDLFERRNATDAALGYGLLGHSEHDRRRLVLGRLVLGRLAWVASSWVASSWVASSWATA
jgi:hypothetical protein